MDLVGDLVSVYILGLLTLYDLKYEVSGTCSPFIYDRHAGCPEALATGTYDVCSSVDFTLERKFCEVRTLDDITALESVARVLNYTEVCSWQENGINSLAPGKF